MTDDVQIQYENHRHAIAQVNHENHYVYYNDTNDDYDEQYLGTYLAFDILACGLIISFIKTCYDKVLIGVNERRNRRNDQENLLTSYEHITILCKEDFNNDVCSICLDNLYDEEECKEIIKIKCNHMFHKECLEPWLIKQRNCPLCKTKIN